MGEAEQIKKKKHWLSHPMANLVVGFLLTGVLGTAITQHVMYRQEKESLRREATIARKEAIEELSLLIVARQLQTQMFVEAIESGAPSEEIKKLKNEYFQAYKDWRTDSPSTMLLAREVMSVEDYVDFEQYVEVRLVENTLNPMRECILNIISKSKERQAALAAIEKCNVNQLNQTSITCSKAIVEGLYVFTRASTTQSGAADVERVSQAKQRIEQDCP